MSLSLCGSGTPLKDPAYAPALRQILVQYRAKIICTRIVASTENQDLASASIVVDQLRHAQSL